MSRYDDELDELEDYEDSLDEGLEKEGCYIATAVYGSYDCPEVWVLRRFRDEVLKKHLLGRAFIRTYYFISPKMVRLFGKRSWFTALFRRILDPIVMSLRNKGYKEN